MYWTVHLHGGPSRVNHAAVEVSKKIYSFGGYCTGEDYSIQTPIDIHVLDTDTYRWTCLTLAANQDQGAVPYQRYGHTVVKYNGKCFLWGGRNDEASCDILYCFNPATRLWTTPEVSGDCPMGRDGHSACVINNCMYIFGGYEDITSQYTQDVRFLDFRTMVWSSLLCKGNPPRWRDFHSASAIGNRMYIFGGRSDVGGPYHTHEEIYDSKIIYLDTVTKEWNHPLTFLTPHGRRSHSAFEYKGNLYVIGGYNGDQKKHFNNIYCYKPASNTWHDVRTRGERMTPRRRQCAILIDSKLFVFGGTCPNPEVKNSYLNSAGHRPENLIDQSDLYVLDMNPSLKTLCLLVAINHNLPTEDLPSNIRTEMKMMTKNNTISRTSTTNG